MQLLISVIKFYHILSTGKLIPVAYGVQKLQISCVVEDDKVGTDFLEEKITKFEDFVSKTWSVKELFVLWSRFTPISLPVEFATMFATSANRVWLGSG